MNKNIETTEPNECYICLDTINLNENDFLELNCCKNNVHLNCLKQWYIKHNTSNCFICNQTNEICKELAHTSTTINNIHYIQIQPIHSNSALISPPNPNPNPNPTPIIYTKNKLTALIICYTINFFILLNLIIIVVY
jgi:hypothetical protein